MTAVATVRDAGFDRGGRRNEVERVVAGFAGHGVLPCFRHVALDTPATDACEGVVCVLRDGLVLKTGWFSGCVAREAEGIGVGRFDGHRAVTRTMRIMAVGALQSGVVHGTLQERVALYTVLVRSPVVPEFGGLLVLLWLETFPELREFHARLVAHGPGVLCASRLAGQMARQTNVHRPVTAQPGGVDDIVRERLIGVSLSWAMTTFTGNVVFSPALCVAVGPSTVTPGTQFEIRPVLPILVVRIPPIASPSVRLPRLFFHAPLGRKHDFFPVDLANKALLPPAANHPLDIFQREVPVRAILTEVGEDGWMGAFRHRRLDHLCVQRVLPITVVVLVAFGTRLRSDVLALVNATPLSLFLGKIRLWRLAVSRGDNRHNADGDD